MHCRPLIPSKLNTTQKSEDILSGIGIQHNEDPNYSDEDEEDVSPKRSQMIGMTNMIMKMTMNARKAILPVLLMEASGEEESDEEDESHLLLVAANKISK